jgi:hypothetical protein
MGSLREFDAGVQGRKKLALVVAIAALVTACAGIVYLAAGRAPDGDMGNELNAPSDQKSQEAKAVYEPVHLSPEEAVGQPAHHAPALLPEEESKERDGAGKHGRTRDGGAAVLPTGTERQNATDEVSFFKPDHRRGDDDKKTHSLHNETPRRHNETLRLHNETRNGSSEREGHNHSDHQRHHHHKECAGGPAAACSCIVECQVFKDQGRSCDHKDHKERQAMVASLIQESLQDHHDMCSGMRCISKCAKQLGCLDEKVQSDCILVEKSYERHRQPHDPSCNLECDV